MSSPGPAPDDTELESPASLAPTALEGAGSTSQPMVLPSLDPALPARPGEEPGGERGKEPGGEKAGSQREATAAAAAGRIGPYELRGELARGGMGAVFRAFHPGLKREVALKVLLAGRGASTDELARFRREAEAAARLQHPGIVAIHDVGEDQGVQYLVMDLVEGQGLDRRIRQGGPLPPREAAELTRTLAEALAYAHTRAVLHRDMKPANVLLDKEGRPRITDFGLAKDLALDEGLTRTGVIMGTPAYMPPEQARGDQEAIDRRADVYSLGATLYEMLVGRPPFRGPSPQVIYQVLRAEPVRPRRLRPELDRDLETICLRCLEKDPQARYGTAQALADDLGRWLAGAPIEARPPGPLERLTKWSRRNPALAGVSGAALLLVLLVGGASAVLLPRRERQRLAASARTAARAAAGQVSALGSSPGAQLGPALEALQAAQRWHDLDPHPDAARAHLEAACTLGEVALAGEQWDLARQCYQEAAALGVDDARGQAGLLRVERARRELALARRAEVQALLARARAGELAREPEGLLDAVFALVRYPEPQTVELLADELDQVSQELLRLEREALLGAALPHGEGSDREGDDRAGNDQGGDETGWEGLAAALDERAAQAGVAPLSSASEALWRRACERAHQVMAGGKGRGWQAVLAAHQRAHLGARLDAARVACDALGRIGLPAAEASLSRYLEASADEDEALHAARALARLGSAHGARLVQRARRRFGLTSRFSSAVAPLLARSRVALELEAEGGRGVWERGEARLAQGDLEGARADFERAVELEPQLSGAWSNLGLVRQQQGDLEGALSAYARALELSPQEGALHHNRASLLWTRGDVAAASSAYARAVELSPREARFRASYAAALETQGQLDDALRELDVALQLDPSLVAQWLQRGDLHLRRGERALAGADYERALALDPRCAQAWADRGWLRRLESDAEAAVADLRRALELDPRVAQTWDMLGSTLWGLEDAAGALEAFARAVELAPDDPLKRVRRGFCLAALDRHTEAIADFDRALSLQPGLPPALLGRGDARRAAGDPAGAVGDYDAVLAAHPELVAAWNNRGLALLELSRPDEALESYERGLALEDSPTLWSNKGDALAARGDAEAARAAYDQALARLPGYVEALVGRAALRAAGGDHAGARDDAAAALASAPEDVRALLLRGRALRALGEPGPALADLRRALALDPAQAGLAEEVAALEGR